MQLLYPFVMMNVEWHDSYDEWCRFRVRLYGIACRRNNIVQPTLLTIPSPTLHFNIQGCVAVEMSESALDLVDRK